jgi:3-oxoacyl-[acyl-carrier protein] reductase
MGPSEAGGVVLITGAAGGLGQGLVRAFASQGWRVAAAYHCGTSQEETNEIWPVQMDVASRASVHAAFQHLIQRWGRVDALINNAGLLANELLPQMSEEAWDKVLDTNLKGAFLCSQAVLRPMLKQRGGHIINISSWSARGGGRGQVNYAAAKAGILGLTTSLAKEVGSRNVRVNAVFPGVLPTKMIAHLTPEQVAEFAAANALGRINSIEEVARFVVFLASLRNVSGQIFQLDSRIARWS